MTASDKNKVKILAALVVIAGLVWFLWYRPSTTASPSPEAVKAASKAKALKSGQEAQIRLDRLEDIAAEDAGRKNIFQYRQKPVAPPPETKAVYIPPAPVTPIAPISSAPIAPVAPPSKSFRYEGYSLVTNTGKILASLSEGGTTYYAKEGECIMGQYCIRRLTETQAEIEDIVQKRRQTVQRVP